jgi:hypothetical protein
VGRAVGGGTIELAGGVEKMKTVRRPPHQRSCQGWGAFLTAIPAFG